MRSAVMADMAAAIEAVVEPTGLAPVVAARKPRRGLADEAKDTFHAIELIEMGARMQLLEQEINLSRERMLRLYREVRGVSPPKGMLPFSADWYMVWRHNLHASLFYNIYLFLRRDAGAPHVIALIKGFRLYLEHCAEQAEAPALDVTRARTLIRFFDADMLQLTACSHCGGRFVAHRHDPQAGFICAACRPPSRAGKGNRPGPA
jgi:flagellar transcriptional activator FlhC